MMPSVDLILLPICVRVRVQVLDLRLNKYNVEVAQHMAAAIDRNSKLREFGVGQTVLPIRSIRDDKVGENTV